MPPGAERRIGALLAAAVLTGALPLRAQDPDPGLEDLAAAVAELDALDQAPTAADIAAALADDRDAPDRAAGSVRLRWNSDAAGRATRDLLAQAGGRTWDLRARARRRDRDVDLVAGTGSIRRGALGLRLGGWTWRGGFGLAAGGAGRAGAAAADGGLGPGRGGGRGWTGGPDPAAGVGAVVSIRTPWFAALGWGRGEDGADLSVAALGARNGTWGLLAASVARTGTAVAAFGRWRRGPWRGAWELAWRPGAADPGAGFHAAWRGRRAGGEALVVAVPRGEPWPVAAAQPLLGRASGRLWALRVSWRPGPGTSLAVLAAGAGRDDGAVPAPERRQVGDLVGRVSLPQQLALEARLRTTTREVRTWSAAWPWAAPRVQPGRRVQVLSLALIRRVAVGGWRLRLASLAVDHAATVGRRTLFSAAWRRASGAWRTTVAWRAAWGAPVDLADAVSPLPGLLVPRHWGRVAGGWFVGAGRSAGPLDVDAAVDLRERDDGGRQLELWLGARGRW